MTVKVDGAEPNVFPAVVGVDTRDVGQNAEVILATKIEGKLTAITIRTELWASRRAAGAA
jgi:hypothetical protein